MQVDSSVVTIVLTLAAIVIWAIRLEGRINGLERRTEGAEGRDKETETRRREHQAKTYDKIEQLAASHARTDERVRALEIDNGRRMRRVEGSVKKPPPKKGRVRK